MLILLSGKKRRGKDTVANYLVEKHGFNRHGFADKVKAYLYAINPIIFISFKEMDAVGMVPYHTFETIAITDEGHYYRLQYLVDTFGWERTKEIKEVRQLLQRTGTEGGRSIFWKDFWVDVLFKELEEKYGVYSVGMDGKTFQSNVVISDCRFPNEAERGKEFGGHVILIDSVRAGLPEPDSHASEQDLPPHLLDGTLHNNGTIEELYEGVEGMLDYIGFVRVK